MLCSPIQSSCALRVNPSVLANPIPFPALLFVFLLPQIQQIRGRAGLDSLSVAATDSSEPARWRMHPGQPLWSPSSTGARSSRGEPRPHPSPPPVRSPVVPPIATSQATRSPGSRTPRVAASTTPVPGPLEFPE
jgi:hypothetical protein